MFKPRSLGPVAFLAALFFSGCTLFPADGPNDWDFSASQKGPLPYSLVRLSPQVVEVLKKNLPRIAGVFQDRSPPKDIRFGVGT